MKNIFQPFLNTLLSAVFPEKCCFCGRMDWRTQLTHGICPDCQQRIYYLENPDISEVASEIQGAPHRIFCSCRYTDAVKKAIISLKYGGKGHLAEPLSWIIFNGVCRKLDFSGIDFICAVPSSREKLRERGYNQAELLARGLSRFCGVPYIKDVLIKNKDLTSQSLLNMEQRLKSVSGTFIVPDSTFVSGKNIILLDDVLTTGATIIECAKMLREGGASSVTAVILATGKRNV